MSPKLTRTPPWAVGMQKLGPGMYIDGKTIHVSEQELCDYFGVPYNEGNIRVIEKAAREAMEEHFGPMPVSVKH